MKDKNRRKFMRVQGNFDLRIDPYNQTEVPDEFEIGKIIDMSASGLLFKYSKPIAVGEKIYITFLTPKLLEVFKVNAKVVRIEDGPDEGSYYIGGEFFDLKEDIEKLFDYYLTNEKKS